MILTCIVLSKSFIWFSRSKDSPMSYGAWAAQECVCLLTSELHYSRWLSVRVLPPASPTQFITSWPGFLIWITDSIHRHTDPNLIRLVVEVGSLLCCDNPGARLPGPTNGAPRRQQAHCYSSTSFASFHNFKFFNWNSRNYANPSSLRFEICSEIL